MTSSNVIGNIAPGKQTHNRVAKQPNKPTREYANTKHSRLPCTHETADTNLLSDSPPARFPPVVFR